MIELCSFDKEDNILDHATGSSGVVPGGNGSAVAYYMYCEPQLGGRATLGCSGKLSGEELYERMHADENSRLGGVVKVSVCYRNKNNDAIEYVIGEENGMAVISGQGRGCDYLVTTDCLEEI